MSGNGTAAPIDPVGMARRDLRKALPRRFFTEVRSAPVEGGHGVLLDGRPVRTPAKALLAVPTAALAGALADEWRVLVDVIDPEVMPLTRLANSAIDGVAMMMEATAAETARFAETDLVCYRAGEPAALVEEQARAWDPILAFARDELGATFVRVEGVIHVPQPREALAAVREAVDALGTSGPFRPAALNVMTNLTGSVLLALAVVRGRLPVAAAWTAAHVDEDYQARMWGRDDDAEQRRGRRWRDMAAAARLAALAHPPGL